ncbi:MULTISPECIES: NAD(P)-binding protein [unclassified Methylobacterium]|uniref:FAD-dependent oxidoreductase n=1 Tax=unclassified Methylobacterium TaxID=2615210 RepID=UPI0011C20A46|nr:MULTISPECIES: NAD(P)-binding protein [unclassified Methylobacterium]QEE42328.1 FAD-binding protein [Methylobacterium sp. WL1]TXN59727.1 NAD(P)-binding protein [Methylobacterium sp. WL2]
MIEQTASTIEHPDSAETFEAVVLGAGISGLVSAAVLHEQGYRRVLVIDEFDRYGGNHIDCAIGPYTFDIGSFIFQDDSPLLAHFPEMLPLYVPIDPTWGKLTPQGAVAGYPLSIKDDILRSGLWGCARIGLSVLYSRISRPKIGNARDFARYWIGNYLLQRSGLESYMTRFFGTPAEKVDLDFAEKRMLWIKEHSSPRAMLRHLRPHKASAPTNRQLARPRSGYHDLYTVAAEKLVRQGTVFQLGSAVSRISKVGAKFQIEAGGQTLTADRVVSTIPINHALDLCGIGADENLTSVTLISLFFSFSGRKGFDCSVLYNFSHKGFWKRLTMYSDFYGAVEGRHYFGVEVIASQAGNSLAIAEQDFRSHVAQNHLFDGDLKLEGGRFVPNAYPIYVNGAQARVAVAQAKLRAFGIESFGRQGGFDYQPTARVSTQTAEAHLRRAVQPTTP